MIFNEKYERLFVNLAKTDDDFKKFLRTVSTFIFKLESNPDTVILSQRLHKRVPYSYSDEHKFIDAKFFNRSLSLSIFDDQLGKMYFTLVFPQLANNDLTNLGKIASLNPNNVDFKEYSRSAITLYFSCGRPENYDINDSESLKYFDKSWMFYIVRNNTDDGFDLVCFKRDNGAISQSRTEIDITTFLKDFDEKKSTNLNA